jgi:hypothetical protein
VRAFPKAKLERVRVEETANNSFEYAGENANSDSEVDGVRLEGNRA